MPGQEPMTLSRRFPMSTTSRDTPFLVNSIRYIIGDPVKHWAHVRLFEDQNDFSLTTVIGPATEDGCAVNIDVAANWIEKTVQQYESLDDVFQRAFLSTVLITPSQSSHDQNVSVPDWIREYSKEQGTNSIHALQESDSIQPGPYVVLQHQLYHVWRLYDDTHGTFMTALRPQEGPFEELDLLGNDTSFRAVAVPSRIHSRPTKEKPLNGMRFAVKDIYHLKGIRTSFGSRSYYNVHGPESETAEAVSKLQNLGAVVLGKLKLTQYGAWEEPAEAVDYPAPFNPRADGFQSPAGSSSGPACALAAYDWMDVTLGSDTTGSILRPGLWAGLFGFRPTWHAVSYAGMGGAIEQLDMAGCYARSIQGLRDFAYLWLNHDELVATPEAFTSIIWASDMWDPVDEVQQTLARDFVRDLETHLEIKTMNVSFEKIWDEKPPLEAHGSSLGDYINDACDEIFFEMFQRFQDFIEKHEKKFGFPPYLSPANTADWKLFRTITEDQWKEALKRMDVYRSWFRDTIVAGESSRTLFVLPIEYLAPRYRDEQPNFRRPPPGVNSLTLAPVMKAPELVIPIGEIPYQSKITKQEEQLPFAVGIMDPPGTDLHLMNTIQNVLKHSGRPQSVYTGKFMFKRQEKPSWLGGSTIVGREE